MARSEIEEIERLVNQRILEDLPVRTEELPTDEARKLPGVKAFFGEKYGETVRVVRIGDGFSREFCGGTHLARTGRAGVFKIVGEEAVAKGVRRITALTGPKAVEYLLKVDGQAWAAAGELNVSVEELPARVAALKEEIKKLNKQLREGGVVDLRAARERLLATSKTVGGTRVIVGEMPQAHVEKLRECLDWFRERADSVAVLVGTRGGGRVMLLAAMSDDLVKRGLRAAELVREVAPLVGGKGGGKPELAEAGGKDAAKLPEALEASRSWIRARLEG